MSLKGIEARALNSGLSQDKSYQSPTSKLSLELVEKYGGSYFLGAMSDDGEFFTMIGENVTVCKWADDVFSIENNELDEFFLKSGRAFGKTHHFEFLELPGGQRVWLRDPRLYSKLFNLVRFVLKVNKSKK